MSQDDTELKAMAEQVRSVIHAEKGRRWLRPGIVVPLALLLAAAMVCWYWPQDEKVRWQTVAVDRGDMVLTATATGNLKPKSEVAVGAEISGLVREVLVKENDLVSKGDVLANFDTQELQVALDQADARLALAQASVDEARATLEETQVEERRIVALMQRNLASAAERDRVVAGRKRAEAKLTYTLAAVREARAALSQSHTRMEKAVITSPITGVVLQRSIEPGATVAASFQTPQLFFLAEDLSQMELHVALDEADVGLVKTGQKAVFSVDAWASQEFHAEVLSVYLYPTTENNVVTYTTVLTVDNSDGLLLPGMTATATVTTGTRDQILRVPNAALRFTPPADHSATDMFSHPGSQKSGQNSGPGNTVWVLRDGEPKRVLLRIGASDGRFSEVLSDEISAGERLLVGVKTTASGNGVTGNGR